MRKKFPLGVVLSISIVFALLIAANVVGYKVLSDARMSNLPPRYEAEERYHTYPYFSGEIEEIYVYDIFYGFEENPITGEKLEEQSEYYESDTAYIGAYGSQPARFKVVNQSGEHWFQIDNDTYLYYNLAPDGRSYQVGKGKHVIFAYDENDTGEYTHVVAVKDGTIAASCWHDRADKTEVLLPSIVVFVLLTISIILFSIRNDEGRRKKGLCIVAVILTASAVIVSALEVYIVYRTCDQRRNMQYIQAHAPIIYLYNDNDEEINVKLDLNGDLTETWPTYNTTEGWTVTASPDGTLTDADGNIYPFLFWEADLNMNCDLSKGYCISGSDTEVFLDDALSDLGMNDKEISDFKSYWLPLMRDNSYNVITFQTTGYTDAAKLDVTPAPDVVVRVNMLWYSSDEFVEIDPQDLDGMNPSLDERHDMVLVEWGGEIYPEK